MISVDITTVNLKLFTMKVGLSLALVFSVHLCILQAAEQTEDWGARATSAINDQQFMLALPLLEQAVRSGDDSELTMSNIVWVWYSLGEMEEAERTCAKALEQYPISAPLSYSAALIASNRGLWEEALKHISVAASIDEKYEEYRNVKGYLLVYLGRTKEAEELLKEVDLNSYGGKVLSAVVADAKGSPEEALRILRPLSRDPKESFGAKYFFGRIASTQPECSKKDAELAFSSMVDVLNWAQKRKVEFAPPCLLYLFTACTLANVERYAAAEAVGTTALRLYEPRCRVNKEVFEQALDRFKDKKRFVKTRWP